ncbi:hypothetical protein CK203_035383 [Vitis vinifera]|uniref:Reverse transcriptase zinc-binding domain-containing protein n=1 Tax=Vitis vinifera TaxID=29760 RepID=A0A438I3P2_VITVI|nr:hypothetical protein CK203_035383 [Vitis vinifera]
MLSLNRNLNHCCCPNKAVVLEPTFPLLFEVFKGYFQQCSSSSFLGLEKLNSDRPSLEEDSVMWRRGRNGQFRVKEAYRLLANPNDIVFPSRCIWVERVPTKVAFFAWEATWEKVLILDRLQIRGGVEVCCADEGGKPFRKDWVEGGRNYKILSSKSRSLGVSPALKSMDEPFAISKQVEEESGDLSCLEVRMGDRASGKVVGQVSNEGSLNSGKGELETNPSISTSRGGEVEDKVAGPYGCFLVAKGLQSKLGLVEEVEASRLSLVKAYGTFVELGLGCSKESQSLMRLWLSKPTCSKGRDCSVALGNELRGGDEFGRDADAVRGHLRMVLQDGLAMVFLENPSSKLESNAISESEDLQISIGLLELKRKLSPCEKNGGKIGGRTLSQGWKKKQSSTFQFDSELRRLNCLISYEGGILVFWDNMVLELLDMECGGFSISYCFRNCEDGFVWIFTGACKLVLRGRKRIFGKSWELSKTYGKTCDHCPIVLGGGGIKKGKISFRFENMWLKTDGFKDLIRNWCTGHVVYGSSRHCLAVKLKALKDSKKRVPPLLVKEVEARKVALDEYKKWA